MEDLPTRAQLTIRLLLRGLPLPEGARTTIASHTVLIIGRAIAARWSDDVVERGDLEAVSWAQPDRAELVIAELRSSDRVLNVRIDSQPQP